MAACVLLADPVCANETAVSLNTSRQIEWTKVVLCLSSVKNKRRSLAREIHLSGNTSE